MIATEIRRFLAALMFFSRIPCPTWKGSPDVALQHAVRYFPLIGWLVGTASAAIFWVFVHILPLSVATLLCMVSAMLLTGAMHEDGFADSCDGFGGGWTREQVLRIMQDPRLGTYGVVGIVMLLALKFAVLNNLRPVQVPFVLVAAHAASRFVAVSLVHSHPYVRPEGTGKSHAVVQSTSRVDLLVAALFGLLPMVFFPTNQALLILAGLLAARITAGRYLTRRLGGYTGDCLGAVQQFSEVVFYLTALATA